MSKRLVLVVAGGILLASGGAVAAGGGALMAVVGSDNSVSAGRHAIATPTSALVVPIDDIRDPGADMLGRPTVKLSATGAQEPVFVGVGPAADVDRYLSGAAVDTVRDLELDPWQLSTTRSTGTAQPPAPAQQTFWVARADGPASAELSWKIRNGDYRLVIMNADGSPGVDLYGNVRVRIPHLFDIGITALAGGLLVVLASGALLVLGLRTPRRPPAPTFVPLPRQPELHASAQDAPRP
jgi:hypothetical protein